MKFSDLVVLLPCTSLEDLPLDWQPAEAEEILSAYSALWHPRLVASAGSMPRWARAEDPPQGPEGALIVVPPVCQSRLPADWLSRAEGWGLCVLRGLRSRAQIISAALERLDGGPEPAQGLCPELVRDFLALGYAHLITELSTRQIRYMSNLDEVRLGREVVSAAQAAVGGQPELAQDHLRAALDTLVEARQYYYPAETYLLDVTVVAVSTLGPSLAAALAAALHKGRITNLLLGAVELEQLAKQAPETLELVQRAWSEKKIGILAGGKDEASLPLLPLEALLEHLQGGLGAFQRYLGQRPRVFGRRRYGLSVVLPQILAGLGLEGVFHGALDEGRFPTSHQSKIRWEGLDGTTVDGLGRVPLDAAQPDSFLRIARLMGDTLDWDQSNMAMLAHWPGQAAAWLEDLHRIDRYSSAVGRFVTVEDYLEQTRYAGQQRKYSPDEYRTPYLRQEVARGQPDPISRWVYYHRLRARWEQLRTIRFLIESLTGLPTESEDLSELQEAIRTIAAQEGPFRPEQWPESLMERQALADRLDSACWEMLARLAAVLCPGASVVPAGETRLAALAERMPESLPRSPVCPEPSAPEANPAPKAAAVLIVNPASFARRMWFSAEDGAALANLDGVRLAGRQQGRLHTACEVAGMGFLRVELKDEAGISASSELSPWAGPTVWEEVPTPTAAPLGSVHDSTQTVSEGVPAPAPMPTSSEQEKSSSAGPHQPMAQTARSPSASPPEEPTAVGLPDELIYPAPKRAGWAARLVGKKPRPLPPLAEEYLLRNEFFEARLDPTTGALRGVYTYGRRGPRCAQQLALRMPSAVGPKGISPDTEQNYTIMAADRIQVLSAGPVLGEIEVQGRLMTHQGQLAARFRQIFRCRRADPILEILIHLEPLLEPEPDPWNSYYACRFAWADQTAELFRSVHQISCRSEADRLETPWFVDLRTERERITLLLGGLPYHRRIGVHKLDTLLIVRGETARWFRVGIGVDLKHPMPAAWDFLAPPMLIPLRPMAIPVGTPLHQHLPSPQQVPAHQHSPGHQQTPSYQQAPSYQQVPSHQQVPSSQQRHFHRQASSNLAHQQAMSNQEALGIPAPAAGWFFHLNVRNVLATAWESIVEDGWVRGFRVRLVETEGRATTAQLRSLRRVASAALVDFTGKHCQDLAVEEDKILIPVRAYQYLQVEARYA